MKILLYQRASRGSDPPPPPHPTNVFCRVMVSWSHLAPGVCPPTADRHQPPTASSGQQHTATSIGQSNLERARKGRSLSISTQRCRHAGGWRASPPPTAWHWSCWGGVRQDPLAADTTTPHTLDAWRFKHGRRAPRPSPSVLTAFHKRRCGEQVSLRWSRRKSLRCAAPAAA